MLGRLLQPYYETLKPGEQVTMSYSFLTAANLPPREFLVSHYWVFFSQVTAKNPPPPECPLKLHIES